MWQDPHPWFQQSVNAFRKAISQPLTPRFEKGFLARPEFEETLGANFPGGGLQTLAFCLSKKLPGDPFVTWKCPHAFHIHPDRARARDAVEGDILSMRDIEMDPALFNVASQFRFPVPSRFKT